MPLTKIESLLYGNLDFANFAAMVGDFAFADGAVTVDIVAVPQKKFVAKARFENAAITSIWVDRQDSVEWPLDIMASTAIRKANGGSSV